MNQPIYDRQRVNFQGPNVLLDVANFTRGQQDELAIQRNRLMLDQQTQTAERDQAFRTAAPAAIGGDPAAMETVMGADPERGLQLRQTMGSLDDATRKRALGNLELIGRGAASLLALPEPQAARMYPQTLAQLQAAGVDVSTLPTEYPGRQAIEAAARQAMTVTQQLKAVRTGGGGGGGGSGGARPAAGPMGKAPVGFRYSEDGTTLEPIPGGPRDPAYVSSVKGGDGQAGGGRALPSPERTQLLNSGQRLAELDRLGTNFDPSYGGFKAGFIGDAVNTIARNTGGDSPRANWWQSYQSLKNAVRNEMFGAALTATEKAEFEKSDINPGMSPEAIRANLANQTAIVRRAIVRRGKSLAADRYNTSAIEEATGVSLGGDAAPPAAAGPGAQTAPAAPSAPADRKVVRTGTLPDGRRVVQYSDGTTEAQ
jgi:hypothetical protein